METGYQPCSCLETEQINHDSNLTQQNCRLLSSCSKLRIALFNNFISFKCMIFTCFWCMCLIIVFLKRICKRFQETAKLVQLYSEFFYKSKDKLVLALNPRPSITRFKVDQFGHAIRLCNLDVQFMFHCGM